MITALLVLLFVFRLAGPVWGFITFLVMGIALAVFTVRDRHGQSRISRMVAKRAHRKAVNRRTNLYRSGPVGLMSRPARRGCRACWPSRSCTSSRTRSTGPSPWSSCPTRTTPRW
ncbi:hypothetical protein [Sinomonas atrocyanea]